jgi:hypothetical protein
MNALGSERRRGDVMVLDLRAFSRPHLPDLPHFPHLTAAAQATWLERMVNEHASSQTFLALADQFDAVGMGSARSAACRKFADEERMHGVLCGAVVEALGGQARANTVVPATFPLHPAVAPVVGVLRNVVSVCCMAETVAVSLIGAERLEMPEGSLRELLTRIWADEVGHARFGWKLLAEILPNLGAPARKALDDYLPVAFVHLEQHELAHIPADTCPPSEGAALGLCTGKDARALFYATVEEAIVPELTALGLQAESAWRDRAGDPALLH